jgi:hypothetical protein
LKHRLEHDTPQPKSLPLGCWISLTAVGMIALFILVSFLTTPSVTVRGQRIWVGDTTLKVSTILSRAEIFVT